MSSVVWVGAQFYTLEEQNVNAVENEMLLALQME
jgi:hypothetical protein